MNRIAFCLVTAIVIIIPPVASPSLPQHGLHGPGTWMPQGRGRSLVRPLGPMMRKVPLLYAPGVVIRSKGDPLVAIRLVFRAGSQDDPPGKEGLAALTAALSTQSGSHGITPEELDDRFYAMATALSADCRKEITVFSSVVHSDNLNRFVPLASTILMSPRFEPDVFERLRAQAIARLVQGTAEQGEPDLARTVRELGLGAEHPYAHATLGTVAGLKAITLDDVREFHQSHYTSDALVVGVAGSAEPATIEQIRQVLAPLSSAPFRLVSLPRRRIPRGLEVTCVDRPGPSATVALGCPVEVTPRDDDYYALMVARAHLDRVSASDGPGLACCESGSVERAGLQERAPGRLIPQGDPRRQNDFTIDVGPVPADQVAAALARTCDELDRLVQRGLTEAEFARARDHLLAQARLAQPTLALRLTGATDGAFFATGDVVAELSRRLPGLTASSVNAALRRCLAARGLTVAIVTPRAAAVRSSLEEKLGASRKDLHVRVVSAAELFR